MVCAPDIFIGYWSNLGTKMGFSSSVRSCVVFCKASASRAVVLLAVLAFSQQVSAQEDSWAATVSKAADSVVSIQLSQLRNFSEARQGNTSATGFVVDAERGIILTNRHVVGAVSYTHLTLPTKA